MYNSMIQSPEHCDSPATPIRSAAHLSGRNRSDWWRQNPAEACCRWPVGCSLESAHQGQAVRAPLDDDALASSRPLCVVFICSRNPSYIRDLSLAASN